MLFSPAITAFLGRPVFCGFGIRHNYFQVCFSVADGLDQGVYASVPVNGMQYDRTMM